MVSALDSGAIAVRVRALTGDTVLLLTFVGVDRYVDF